MERRTNVPANQPKEPVVPVKKNSKRKWLLIAGVVLLVLLTIGFISGYSVWKTIYANNVTISGDSVSYLFVKTGSDYNALLENISRSGLLKNSKTFKWVAGKKNLEAHVNPGRYEIKPGMSNNQIVDLLRSGKQKPLNVTFNNIRTTSQLASVIGRQIEADSLSLIRLLKNQDFTKKYGFNSETIRCMFIPNTYQFFWNTSAEDFYDRMNREYKTFWNETRRKKAEKQRLTPSDVSILASIVEKETNKNDEKPRVAGVYLNRLHDNWLLQADPTLVYASGDFELRRVLNIHKEIESPYNTYKYVGLPPGPICIPSINSIESVLNAENHDYYFFVARPDDSGYHNFSKSLRQHNEFVNQYRRKQNQRSQNR